MKWQKNNDSSNAVDRIDFQAFPLILKCFSRLFPTWMQTISLKDLANILSSVAIGHRYDPILSDPKHHGNVEAHQLIQWTLQRTKNNRTNDSDRILIKMRTSLATWIENLGQDFFIPICSLLLSFHQRPRPPPVSSLLFSVTISEADKLLCAMT